VLLLACACGGTPVKFRTAHITGTCEEMCQRYEDCKTDSPPRPTCRTECQEIFVDNGQPDRASLLDYQQLSCDEAVAFIEGTPRASL
jgi:hypothetical protein